MLISIYEMSFLSSILIVIILLTRRFAFHYIRKNIIIFMWKLVLLRLLIPFSLKFNGKNTIIQMALEPIKQVTVHINNNTNLNRLLICVYCFGITIMSVIYLIKYILGYKSLVKCKLVDEKQYKWWIDEQHIRKVKIFEIDMSQSPFAYGFFSPIIVVPSNIKWNDKERMNFVLTHEYMHIFHYDNIFKLFLIIALSVHWFNPLVWLMYIFANRDIEIACDEAVLDKLGNSKRAKYAATLVDMSISEVEMAKGFSLFSQYAIEDRVMAISKVNRKSFLTVTFSLFLVIVTCTLFFKMTPKIRVNIDESNLVEDIGIYEHSDYLNQDTLQQEDDSLWVFEDIPQS